jgi:DNA-binding transcriptional LysR family regulator
MARKLPPLNALRAFEAAARHMSLTKAAAELHVTQAAISHQVKALEDQLGLALFRRLPRGLLLTDAGQTLLPELRDSFDRMSRAVERLRGGTASGVVTISTVTTFALSWLVERLPRFQALHADIDVKVSTSSRLVDFGIEDVDCAVRVGVGPWRGLRRDKLFDDRVTVVCAPALLPRLKTLDDLHRAPRIVMYNDPAEWPTFFAAAGIGEPDERGGLQFDSTRIGAQAALAGAGAILVAPFMFADDLASGRLVQPFEFTYASDRAWWFVTPESGSDRPKVKALREWMLAEAAETPAVPMAQAPPARRSRPPRTARGAD